MRLTAHTVGLDERRPIGATTRAVRPWRSSCRTAADAAKGLLAESEDPVLAQERRRPSAPVRGGHERRRFAASGSVRSVRSGVDR
jgi:hypothetical protein